MARTGLRKLSSDKFITLTSKMFYVKQLPDDGSNPGPDSNFLSSFIRIRNLYIDTRAKEQQTRGNKRIARS